MIALAILLGVVMWSASDPLERAEAGVFGPLAWALPIATPGIVALLGFAERPWLLAVAGLALLPMTMLSFSGVLFVLLIPACTFFGVAVARPRLPRHPKAQAPAAILSLAFLVGAVANLFADRTTRTFTDGTSTWSGEVLTRHTAWVTIGFVVASIAVAALCPKDRPAAPATT